MQANERKLRMVLTINAAFSGVSGVILLLASHYIATMMGIANGQVLKGIGLGLIVFGLTVLAAARRKTLSAKQVKSIIVQDWAWVIGSLLIIALQAWGLTNVGYWLIAIIAMIVADFAIFQMWYLRRIGA